MTALSAYLGAAGLATGLLDLGGTVNGRLPLRSPVLGGVALAVVVALPSTLLTWLAWRADPRAEPAAAVAGLLLIGWIAVEVAVIKEISFFQPAYLAVGAFLVWTGRHRGGNLGALLHR